MTDLRRSILRSDPFWSAYGLADLQEEMEPFCTWTVAGQGLTLLFTGLEPPVLLTVGTATGVADALAQMPKPEAVYLSVQEEHLPGVRRYFDESGDHRPMWRMVWRGGVEARGTVAGDTVAGDTVAGKLIRLGMADGERIGRLYAQGGDFAPDAFDPSQLADGTFWGVEEQGELVAAGGTHIVYAAESVAAVGNIYTRPDRRGQGYGKAVTTKIIQGLRASGYRYIVLNVDQRNRAAISLYEKLGFEKYCPFVEGIAVRRD